MRIRLALVDKDPNYLSRIAKAFNAKYSDKIQMYTFTDYDNAIAETSSIRIDVFVVNSSFDVDFSALPKKCGFAYLVDSNGIATLNGQKTICKFQRIDLVYRQILNVYSENSEIVSKAINENKHCKVIAFTAVSGGIGNSSMAAACALRFASKGKKVIYINLEKFSATEIFFDAEGQFSMSDIIFALKSKKSNVYMKLESFVRLDSRGVYFLPKPKIALDMVEFKSDEILSLISEITNVGDYDYIIIDTEFKLSDEFMELCDEFDSIVFIGDGSEVSNSKMQSVVNSLLVLEKNNDITIVPKISLIYNKFSNKTSQYFDNPNIQNIGGAPRYDNATTRQVVEQLSRMGMLDRLS